MRNYTRKDSVLLKKCIKNFSQHRGDLIKLNNYISSSFNVTKWIPPMEQGTMMLLHGPMSIEDLKFELDEHESGPFEIYITNGLKLNPRNSCAACLVYYQEKTVVFYFHPNEIELAS